MKYERRLGHKLNKIVGRSLSTRKKHGGRISSKNGQESSVVFRKIGNRVLYTENKRRNVCLADAVLSTAVGGVTYRLCLGLLQRVVFLPIHTTSNFRVFGRFARWLYIFLGFSFQRFEKSQG